jgi:hypothetical protein
VVQQSELIILVLSIALVPVVVWTYRGIELPGKPLLACALGAMFGAYVTTVAEGFVAPTSLNALEHLLFAVGGLSFAALCVIVIRAWSPGSEDSG